MTRADAVGQPRIAEAADDSAQQGLGPAAISIKKMPEPKGYSLLKPVSSRADTRLRILWRPAMYSTYISNKTGLLNFKSIVLSYHAREERMPARRITNQMVFDVLENCTDVAEQNDGDFRAYKRMCNGLTLVVCGSINSLRRFLVHTVYWQDVGDRWSC